MAEGKRQFIFLSLLLCTCYIALNYFVARHETFLLLTLFTVVFSIYSYVIFKANTEQTRNYLSLSIFIRIIILFAVPNLSDDFYRFVWDGRLLQAGVHPFAALPSYHAQNGFQVGGINPLLYDALNSKEYFTIYPPIAQGIFYLATLVTDSIYGSMMVMKILVLLSEIASLFFFRKILQALHLPEKNILLYSLNPLVILELCGNIHFEAFVVTFLLASIYFILKSKFNISAIFFSFAVCVKLLPLIFLPSLIFYAGWRKSLIYFVIVGVVSALLFLPLFNQEIIIGLSTSLAYYFKKFEFNASIYYLVREWGYWQYGYNIIQTVGWKLAVISMLLILAVTLYRMIKEKIALSIKPIFYDWSIVLFIYVLFTTTVHPWYIIPLVAFSVFNNIKFPLVWSFFIFLTYAGYSENTFIENYWITGLEYIVVVSIAFFELINKFKQSSAEQLTHNLKGA